ncbi:cysteine peptidase family C39 domain-containing protein [Mycoplasmopsis ciconiae]|uniref:Cysteine peptidase family C39 domain-containing protein n=1 Tax=Mycoplasmopsis ciconiae TaxID=561067 RepID=A0ABU7MMM7_9BACT|nr:cysteine peptidase family C39 domain-containing protein [Mycoplasmopsis ciconiae]
MKQIDIKDCMLVNLAIFIKKVHKVKIDIFELKAKVQYNDEGISISQIKQLSHFYKLQINTYKLDFKDLFVIDKDQFPFVALIEDKQILHSIIIKKIVKNKIYIFDPLLGNCVYDSDKFKSVFAGIVIQITKNGDFLGENKYKDFIFNFSYVYLLFLVVALIINFISPFIVKLSVEKLNVSAFKSIFFSVLVLFLWIKSVLIFSKVLLIYL